MDDHSKALPQHYDRAFAFSQVAIRPLLHYIESYNVRAAS
jgi:hypothetical protein